MKSMIIPVFALGLLATPAFADPSPRDPYGDGTVSRGQAQDMAGKRFDSLDADHDGQLSSKEMEAARSAMGGSVGGGMGGGMGRMAERMGPITRDKFITGAVRRFDRMDANGDGQLTREERAAGFAAMRERWQARSQAGN